MVEVVITPANHQFPAPLPEPFGPVVPPGAASPIAFEALLDDLAAQPAFLGRGLAERDREDLPAGSAEIFNERGLFGDPAHINPPDAFEAEGKEKPGLSSLTLAPAAMHVPAEMPARTADHPVPGLDAIEWTSLVPASVSAPFLGAAAAASGHRSLNQNGAPVAAQLPTAAASPRHFSGDGKPSAPTSLSQRTTVPGPGPGPRKPAAVPTSMLAQTALARAAVTLWGGSARVNVGVQTSELGTQEREQLEQRIAGELARHGLTIGRIVVSAPSVAPERE